MTNREDQSLCLYYYGCRVSVLSRKTTCRPSTRCSGSTTRSPTPWEPTPTQATPAASSPPRAQSGSTTRRLLPPCWATAALGPPGTSTAVPPTSRSSHTSSPTLSSPPNSLPARRSRRNTCSTSDAWPTSSSSCSSTGRAVSRGLTTDCSSPQSPPRATARSTRSSTPSCACAQCNGRWSRSNPPPATGSENKGSLIHSFIIIFVLQIHCHLSHPHQGLTPSKLPPSASPALAQVVHRLCVAPCPHRASQSLLLQSLSTQSTRGNSPDNSLLEPKQMVCPFKEEPKQCAPAQISGHAVGSCGLLGWFLTLRHDYNYQMIGGGTIFLWTAIITQSLVSAQRLFVEGGINQTLAILLPFSHLIEVKVQDQRFASLIDFAPNNLHLETVRSTNNLPSHNLTLFEDLRSPLATPYRRLFKLSNCLVAYQHPSTLLIFDDDNFELKHVVGADLDGDGLQFVELGSNLVVLETESKVRVVDVSGERKGSNIFNTTKVKSVRKGGQSQKQFVYANKTIYEVKIQERTLKIVSKTHFASLSTSPVVTYLVEHEQTQTLWFIDAKGLNFLPINQSINNKQPSIELIHKQQRCREMDLRVTSRRAIEVLLTCQNQGLSSFILLTDSLNNSIPHLLSQTPPHFDYWTSQRYFFSQQFIYSLQEQSLSMYLPGTTPNGKPVYHRHTAALPSIRAMTVEQDPTLEDFQVYAIGGAQGLVQQRPIVLDYTLHIRSSQPVQGDFQLDLTYYCNLGRSGAICKQTSTISVSIHEGALSYVASRSINYAIILVLAIALVALVLVCSHKYNTVHDTLSVEFKALTAKTEPQPI